MKDFSGWMRPPVLLPLLFMLGCASRPPQSAPDAGQVPDQVSRLSFSASPARADGLPSRRTLFELLAAELGGARGGHERALARYRRMVERTRDVALAERGSHLAFLLKDEAALLQLASLWLQVDPDAVPAHRLLFRRQLESGNPEAAGHHLDELIRLGGRQQLAAAARELAELDGAARATLARFLDARLAARPEDADLLFLKAFSLLHGGKAEAALPLVEELLVRPAPEEVFRLQLRLLRVLGRKNEAAELLRGRLATCPDEDYWRVELADLLLEAGELEAARLEYEALHELHPRDGHLLISLARVALRRQHPEQAEPYLRRLLQLGQLTDEAHYHLGEAAQLRADPETALAHFRRAARGELFVLAHTRVATLLAELEGLAAARRYLAERRAARPADEVRLLIAEAQLMLAEGAEAADIYALLDERPAQDAELVELIYFRGLIGYFLDDFAGMERDLRLVLELAPDHADALNTLGYVLADRTDRYEEAYRMIGRAFELRPDDAAIIDSMGWVEYRLRNCEAALAHLQRALRLAPGDDTLAAHLGEVLWALGRRKQAEEVWRKALQATPESEPLQEIMQRLSGSDTELETCAVEHHENRAP